jgi:hypothetical protein
MYVNNRPINSVKADLPASDSLDETLMPELDRVIDRYRGLLNELQLVEGVAGLEEPIGTDRTAP